MSTEVKKTAEIPSAPAEWNVALRDVVFTSIPRFVEFLQKVGADSDKLEFDPAVGTAKGLNGAYSCWQKDGGIQLTGYGISLLHSATASNFELVRPELPQYSRVGVSTLQFSNRLNDERRLDFDDHRTEPLPQVPDRLSNELDLARTARKLFPTANTAEFATHFNELVGQLRGGIPYSDRDQGNALAPSELLKLYLLSFVKDEAALHILVDKAQGGTLSLLESARCITDETRTKKFLSAVRDAVAEVGKSGIPTIEVIDAGCGAVPIQAIQAAISDPRVMVTALMFNPASAAMARQIVEALGLEKQVKVIEADATKYKPENKAHIIVSETLQAGLGGEPVVQILNNLRPHLNENGRMIPESVDIKIGLVPLSEIRNSERKIRTVIEEVAVTNPRWEQTIHYRFGDPLEKITFDLALKRSISESSVVCVGIDVHLGNEVLGHNESLITMPRLVLDGKRIQNSDPLILDDGQSKICVSYKAGGIPIGLAR